MTDYTNTQSISSDNSLKNCIQSIMDRFLPISQNNQFKKNVELSKYFDGFVDHYFKSYLGQKYPFIKINWSVGKGNWAKTPWISFLDQRETTTTQKGVYCVILFKEDMSGCYLTLNQGISEPRQLFGGVKSTTWLKENAIKIRKLFTDSQNDGYIFDSNIDLRTNNSISKYYEIATIAYIEYEKNNIPEDSVILNNLDSILHKYQIYIENKNNISQMNYWIFQSNPNKYDIETALRNGSLKTFSVNQHQKEIKINDKVFLWVSGAKGGIIGIAKVISNPEIMHQEDLEREFVINDERLNQEIPRVRIEIEELLDTKLTKDKILENEILKNMQIFRFSQATNFPVTKEEAKQLMNMIHNEKIEINYTIEDFCRETNITKETVVAWLDAIERKKQAILYGPPGTGKTFIAKKLSKLIIENSGFEEIIQFHPAFAYEDFIQGIRPESDDDGLLKYPMVNGRFIDFCNAAKKYHGKSVLIIDEINRANLSRVFGELMFLMEYRDEKMRLAGGNDFYIPPNVRIIGTMNTADRSIALVDHALRRRFAFIKIFPDFEILRKFHQESNINVTGLISELEIINNEIKDHNYALGVSFFLIENLQEHIEAIWKMEIEPYLEEYFFDDQEKVKNFRWEKVKEVIL